MKPTPNSKKRAHGLRGAALGVELAASLIGFALLGLWIDHKYGFEPWGTLVCVVIGLVGGFYNFIRSSLRVMRAPSFPERRGEEDEQSC